MPSNHNDTLLIFRIDRISCAVAADSVLSIVMPPDHITQPPGSDKGRPGIFRHSGHVFSVIDLHQRFGINTPRRGMGRLLLHEAGIRRHALWVDEVVGLVRSEEGEWAQLPPYLPRSLFHSGFLYQKEIILCSTLDALLAMHDAEPIRLHLQKLHAAELATTSSGKEKRSDIEKIKSSKIAEKEEQAPRPAPASTPIAKALKRPYDSSSKTSTTTPAVATATPVTTKEKAPALGTTPARSTKESPTHTPPRPKTKKVMPLPETAVSAPTSRTAPQTPPTQPADVDKSYNWILWLILALLMVASAGGLYLLLEKPERKRLKSPRINEPPRIAVPQTTPTPQSMITVLEEEEPATPEPEISALSEEKPSLPEPEVAQPAELDTSPTQAQQPLQQPAETIPVGDEPSLVTGGGEATLRVERDEEGIISLIIERKPAPPAVETAAVAEEAKETSDTSPPMEEEETVAVEPQTVSEEDDETPLQPEADWPKPARLVEPCDCIHTVVKGDTLWDIAKRYTNNAFSYPALARESGIRNPHRIYPGDKIRIIVR